MWRSVSNFQELVLCFHHVGLKDSNSGLQLGHGCHAEPSHWPEAQDSTGTLVTSYCFTGLFLLS